MSSKQNRAPSRSQAAKELLCTLSPQGVILSLSPSASDLNGWNDADCVGKSPRTFVHPEEIYRMEDGFPRVLKGESVTLGNVRCLTRMGTYELNDLTFIPVFEDGTLREVLILGNVRSGAQKPVLESLGHAKLLESLLANAPVGFALLDNELRFVVLNEAFSRLSEFSPEQQVGMEMKNLFRSAVALLPTLRNILTTGNAVTEYEVNFGDDRFAIMSFYPIPDSFGGICGIAAIAVDISDRKLADKKLKETSDELTRSNHALESFSDIVSHDLREPLRTISSFAKLLEKEYKSKLDGVANEYIEFISRGADHMRRLIDGTLDFGRAGKTARRFSEVDCNEVLGNVLRNLNRSLEECNGTVTSDLLPTVWGDASLMNQILQNLVSNAIKYRKPPTCHIHIGAKQEAGRWIFSVEDDGIGMSANDIPSLFTPFRRLHPRGQYEGVGLGLSISKKNVEHLGGRIWAESEPGKGSTFSFTVPAVSVGRGRAHELDVRLH